MSSDSMFSKKITGIDYDIKSGILTIQFTSTAIKRYANVPKKIYDKFTAATDKNKFYEQKIDGQYRVD